MIQLIRPPYKTDSICPPINLMALAAYCESHYSVSLTDFLVPYVRNEISLDAEGIRRAGHQILENPAPVLGFTSMCGSYAAALRIARECKRLDPSRFILFGGPHASFVDVDTLQRFGFVDAIVIGEGEQTLLELLQALDSGQSLHYIQGLTFRDGDRVVQTERRPVVNDLDLLPFPAFHLIPNVDAYYEGESVRFMEIEAGRGCPFNCNFCSTSLFFTRRYRVKSPQRIVAEMRWLKEHWNIQSFGLLHDNLTSRKEKVRELCRFIMDTGEEFEWFCSSRADTIDRDLINTMTEAGCRGVFFGVETGSPDMQKAVGKRSNLDNATETFADLVAAGLDSTASFIIGFPEESLTQLEETLTMALKLRLLGIKEVQLHPLSALPGTRILAEHVDRLRFQSHLLTFHDITSVIDMTETEMEWIEQHRHIFSNFYAITPMHYPLELVYQIRGCYFQLIHARPSTLYAMHKLGGLRHTDIVHRLTAKLPSQFEQWTRPELLKALVSVLSELPEAIRPIIMDIHTYEKALATTATFTDGANGWVRYKGSLPPAYGGEPLHPTLKPAQVIDLRYDIPALLRQLVNGLPEQVVQRDSHLAVVFEWQGRRLRTLEVDPLTAHIIGSNRSGEALPACLERLSRENPYLQTDEERDQWMGRVLDHLEGAGLLVSAEPSPALAGSAAGDSSE
ncbi:MAG: B12-binding domain-containing radical SAM protein [Bacillota bacterium]